MRRVTAKGAPPIVVLGTTGDPATPYAWAQSLAGQLPGGVLLTLRGQGHTAYRTRSPASTTASTASSCRARCRARSPAGDTETLQCVQEFMDVTDITAPGLREQKRIATKRALQIALLQLSLERGFDNVTVEEVAQAAQVSPRTFFNYFASKEEAVAAPHGPHELTASEIARYEEGAGDPLTDLIVVMADRAADEEDFELHSLRRDLMLRESRLLGDKAGLIQRIREQIIDMITERLRGDELRAGRMPDEASIRDRAGLRRDALHDDRPPRVEPLGGRRGRDDPRREHARRPRRVPRDRRRRDDRRLRRRKPAPCGTGFRGAEPPWGIEPQTYSLRVNRSTD